MLMEDLDGKVAVITGGGSGIGLATGRVLAQEGARVVLADIDEARLATAVEACHQENLDVRSKVTDVADLESMRQLATFAYDELGGVHILHLNAGIGAMASLTNDDITGWEQAVQVNYFGVVWGIKAFVPRMLEQGEEGVVIATSSGAGIEGTAFEQPAYASTKAAVLTVMECLHGQLKGYQLRAAVLSPPLTRTNLPGDVSYMPIVEEMLRNKGIPATLVEPDQVAQLVLDGIRNDRFFIMVDEPRSKALFNGAISEDFLQWTERVIRGRAEAQLGDGLPDAYLW
jgi:NAD(P)-dependent dehydrogenase (short-subunit alcohol dehydrogenase family)